MNTDIINIVLAGFSLLTAGCSAIAAISANQAARKSFEFTKSTQLAADERKKKQATLDAYNILQEQVCDRINYYQIKDIKDAYRNSDKAFMAELDGYVARIEHYCVGLEMSIYDYDTFYELTHGYFDDGPLKERIDIILANKDLAEEHYSHIYDVWEKMISISRAKTILKVYKVQLNPEDEMEISEIQETAHQDTK